MADIFNDTRDKNLGAIRDTPKDKKGWDWSGAAEGADERAGVTAGQAAKNLVTAENQLIAQLLVTETSFALLEEATAGKNGEGGVKSQLDALKTAMEGAAGTFAGVKEFVGKLNESSGSTVKAIQANDAFLKKSEKVIADQTLLIKGLQKDVEELLRAKG